MLRCIFSPLPICWIQKKNALQAATHLMQSLIFSCTSTVRHKTVRQHHPRFLYTPGWKCTPWHWGPATISTIFAVMIGGPKKTSSSHSKGWHPWISKIFVLRCFLKHKSNSSFPWNLRNLPTKTSQRVVFRKELANFGCKISNLLFKDSLSSLFRAWKN